MPTEIAPGWARKATATASCACLKLLGLETGKSSADSLRRTYKESRESQRESERELERELESLCKYVPLEINQQKAQCHKIQVSVDGFGVVDHTVGFDGCIGLLHDVRPAES